MKIVSAIIISFLLVNFSMAMEKPVCIISEEPETPPEEFGVKINTRVGSEIAPGFAVGSVAFLALHASGVSREVTYLASLTTGYIAMAVYQLVKPDSNVSAYLSVIDTSTRLATVGLAYLFCRQVGLDVDASLATAICAKSIYSYVCYPCIEKYCYELHPDVAKRVKAIDEELKEKANEKNYLEKKIATKKSAKRKPKNRHAQLRNKDNAPVPTTIEELRKQLEDLQNRTAELERERAELNKQKTLKLWRYIGRDKNRVEAGADEQVFFDEEKSEEETPEKREKIKRKGKPFKDGKGKESRHEYEGHQENEANHEQVPDAQISRELKRDLKGCDIEGLYSHQISFDDLVRLVKALGFRRDHDTGSHGQYVYVGDGWSESISLVRPKWNGKQAQQYQRKPVIEILEQRFGITQTMVSDW